MRALFVYWRVEPERLGAATDAARAFQDRLRAEHPGLAARLYQRTDGRATVMETYEMPAGLPEPLAASIIERGAAELAVWATDGRHVERFEEI